MATDARSRISTGRGRTSLTNIRSKQNTLPSALSRAKGTPGGAYDAPKSQGLGRPQAQGTADLDVGQGLRKVAAARTKTKAELVRPDIPTTGVNLSGGIAALNQATTSINANIMAAAAAAGAAKARMASQGQGGAPTINSGPGGPVLKQMAKGFAAAGDMKMARFVRKNPGLMKTWLKAEMWGGGASQPYDGIRNYGYFQFRGLEGRPWLDKFVSGGPVGQGDKFSATPYQEAVLAAKYFDLTPNDVRGYVDQIKAGNYPGWG